jgi:hypothetical protein
MSELADEFDTDGCRVEIKDFCASVTGEWQASNCSCLVPEGNLPANSDEMESDMVFV